MITRWRRNRKKKTKRQIHLSMRLSMTCCCFETMNRKRYFCFCIIAHYCWLSHLTKLSVNEVKVERNPLILQRNSVEERVINNCPNQFHDPNEMNECVCMCVSSCFSVVNTKWKRITTKFNDGAVLNQYF